MHSRSLYLIFFFLVFDFVVSDTRREAMKNQTFSFPPPMITTQRQIFPGGVPSVNPTAPGTAPIVNPNPGSRAWCIASPAASPTALQVALDYACGYGGADCSAIQPSGPCFDPNTVRDHASYAFNDYYQKNPVPTSCEFGGTAQLTNSDPSSGNCRYASSSTGTIQNPPAIPVPMTPPSTTINPYTPTTGYGSEPTGYDYANQPPSSAQSISVNLLLTSMTYLILLSLMAYLV